MSLRRSDRARLLIRATKRLAARPGVVKILCYQRGASRACRSKEKAMPQSGRVAFGAMETVVFGKPAAETVAEEARRRDAERVFLMVSGTLNRTTDEIAKVRRALGNRFAGQFDHMPPHTPRHAVIEAAEMAREAGADLIVTVGGGSITDGAKAVQLCLTNNVRSAEAIGGLRLVKGPDGALGPAPGTKPPSVPQ